MEEVVAEALGALQARSDSDQKSLQVRIESAIGLEHALGDMERVRQILDNLLENSYNYTDAGGRITVRIHPVGDEIQVDVQDNGIGIPPEAQARIFERFYRGEHPFVLATSGTGLGLSIVRHLVAMHGGRIWFESAGIPGKGSTFSFTLPVYRVGESVQH
jgi:two-component system OmpR family sensor kinase